LFKNQFNSRDLLDVAEAGQSLLYIGVMQLKTEQELVINLKVRLMVKN
jgi:hypothetical protein